MRKFKELMRLKFEAGLTHRQIARSLGMGAGTVSRYVHHLQAVGLRWPLPAQLSDADIERRLFPEPAVRPRRAKQQPDHAVLHQELKRKGVTLALLWEEYYEQAGPERAYRYSQFCERYRRWRKRLKRSMRQTHRAGEKLFVDYAGPTIEVIDPATGEVRNANLFVAALGASSYTYAEATWTQQLPDWCAAHARAFAFLGGCPELVVPDNLKSGVSKACRYEPDLNPTYAQLAAHFAVAVLPARPRRPRDKAKVEVAVQVVERWILARLRHHTFFSLAELNAAIATLLEDLNDRPFSKLPGSRRELFERLDRPALKPLPSIAYRYTEVKKASVYIDYHVAVDAHYYSVPHRLVGAKVEVHACATTVAVYHRGRCVAQHVRSHHPGAHTTVPEHMPKSHRAHMQWTPGRFLNWAADIGPATTAVVKHLLTRRPHPEHGYRSCLGLLNLEKRYGRQRLEAACTRAKSIGSPTRKSVLSILTQGLDRVALPDSKQSTLAFTDPHPNVRGSDYYH
jgi:transposase